MSSLVSTLRAFWRTLDARLPDAGSYGNGPAVSWRLCLWLSLPALLLGAWLRYELLRVSPVIFYGADSNSYFETAFRLWQDGEWDLGPKRRWLYPLLLLPLPLSPAGVAVTTAWLQHGAGLLSILALAWITGHLTRLHGLWIPVVTCVYAVLPRALWYEHEMIAEGPFLAVFLFTTAAAFPLARLKTRSGAFWFLLGIGMLGLLKPHGKVLWLAMFVLFCTANRRPLSWGLRSWLVLAGSIVLMATAGSGAQGRWLLLSSTLPMVPLEGSHQKYRDILRPFIEKARAERQDYAFVQRFYKKPLSSKREDNPVGREWADLVRDKKKFQEVAGALARGAILQSPVDYTRLVLEKIAVAAAYEAPMLRLQPAVFWQDQQVMNIPRMERNPEELKLLYGSAFDDVGRWAALDPQPEFRAYEFLGAVGRHTAWCTAWRSNGGAPAHFGIRWLGWLVLAGIAICLVPGNLLPRAFLWAPSAAYVLVCFGIGDSLGRYLQPVEWAGLVLAVLALDALLSPLFRKKTPQPADQLAAASSEARNAGAEGSASSGDQGAQTLSSERS